MIPSARTAMPRNVGVPVTAPVVTKLPLPPAMRRSELPVIARMSPFTGLRVIAVIFAFCKLDTAAHEPVAPVSLYTPSFVAVTPAPVPQNKSPAAFSARQRTVVVGSPVFAAVKVTPSVDLKTPPFCDATNTVPPLVSTQSCTDPS